MKSIIATVAAFAIVGFLFYFLLRFSEAASAPKVAQPDQKEAVAPPPDAPPKTIKK